MIDAVIVSFASSLKKLPPASIPASQIGTAAPTQPSGLPAIVLGLAETRLKVSGIGGVVLEQEIDAAQWDQRFARRLEGVLRIDVYTGGDAEAFSLTGEALEKLQEENLELRAAGFIHMGAVRWERVEVVTLGTGNNGPRAARQTLTMEFVFENIEQQLPGPGGVIEQVDVDVEMEPPVDEDFHIN